MTDNNMIFRLIANPNKLKNTKTYIKNDNLKLYINYKFNTDTKTINNLIIYVEEFINNINLNTFIIQNILNEIITKIDNGKIYRICNQK